jgi:ubiquinol-cytochrome c reductase cytochrome b subunit
LGTSTYQRFSSYLPRLGLASLFICLGSGIVLTFYYRPSGNVFQNVEEITSLVPYGRFFRQAHYSSGQFFVLLMLLHTADHFLKRRYRQYSPKEWIRLVLSLALCFFTLFTGFVLKGDKEGIFAGQILIHILQTLPWAGEALSRIIVEPGAHFFFLPFLYHCLFLLTAILFLLRRHIREWLPDEKYLTITAIGIFAYALLIPPFLDIPPEAPVERVKGPWFFLGLQTLLMFLPPALAGLMLPVAFILLLLLLPALGTRTARVAHYIILVSSTLYLALCLRGWVYAP